MKDWTKTEYGTPKSWDEIQREKRDEEHDRVISGPGTPLSVLVIGMLVAGAVLIGSLAGILYYLFR